MPIASNTLGRPELSITVCICTYQRTELLQHLLRCLEKQTTKGLFKYSIVVVDNDTRQSARDVAASAASRMRVPVAYGVEPRQNIALARNACVSMATGDFIAFIDDDEEPAGDWLCSLYETLVEYGADGVVGPVFPKFEENAPAWAVKGQVFHRPNFRTGEVVHWSIMGTGNLLCKREVLQELGGPFDSRLGAGGEDTDFFRRAVSRGRVFVWSASALCHEFVRPERTRVGFQLRRALLRGKIALCGPAGSWSGILKSAIAVPLYAVALPVCLVMGSHVFVTCLVRAFDHLGKLLATCGVDVVGDKYLT
ncbi:MAG: glycosyltransferase family 2 protein [Bryobacterales bacterium]|nr:glycosyltransferase family 2 protein [Bryobacterales bacterium]